MSEKRQILYWEGSSKKDFMNRPGFELTPISWTVTMPPFRRCFSIGTPPSFTRRIKTQVGFLFREEGTKH